jgi:hypothetical protein
MKSSRFKVVDSVEQPKVTVAKKISCTMGSVPGCWTSEVWVQSQGNPCGICGRQNDTEARSSSIFPVSPCQSFSAILRTHLSSGVLTTVSRFSPKVIHVGFVLDKMAQKQDFSRSFQFSPSNYNSRNTPYPSLFRDSHDSIMELSLTALSRDYLPCKFSR